MAQQTRQHALRPGPIACAFPAAVLQALVLLLLLAVLHRHPALPVPFKLLPLERAKLRPPHHPSLHRIAPIACATQPRIIPSHGKVNSFNLAKNAYTSVEQIEPFYAKHVPFSREMAKNLQSFGEE
jgi:hypothetical protein